MQMLVIIHYMIQYMPLSGLRQFTDELIDTTSLPAAKAMLLTVVIGQYPSHAR
jgi:hypothetical protein